MTDQNSPPWQIWPEATHTVPVALIIDYQTPDSGYASTINFAVNGQQRPQLARALTYRVFRNFYLCDACPLEWEETAICAGPSWCPCCEKETPAYLSLECEEEAVTE